MLPSIAVSPSDMNKPMNGDAAKPAMPVMGFSFQKTEFAPKSANTPISVLIGIIEQRVPIAMSLKMEPVDSFLVVIVSYTSFLLDLKKPNV
jgi:hypothetical protein